jgi:O-antigen ligase
MGLKPEAFDYEGVFPGRARRAQGSDADAEVWSKSGKFESFESDVAVRTGPTTQEPPSNTLLFTETANWIRRRGHAITFFALFLFTVVLYIRPYEFFPALSSFTSMAFYTGLLTLIIYFITQPIVEGNFTARLKEVNLILLLGVAALLSMPLAINRAEAWDTFTELLLKEILIFIVIVNVVRTKRRLNLLLMLAVAVSVYLSINAIQDYQSGLFGVGNEENHNLRIEGRIKGLFENSNDLALHLITIAPIAVALAFVKQGMARKFVYLGAALLMVAAIVVTFSRGGFLALAAVSFFMVRKLGRENRGMATAGFVLGAILFFAVAPGDYAGRLSTIFNTASDLTGSASQRNQVLKRSIMVTLRYPLFGVGIGNFHHKSFQELGTHNAYTQVGSEMGIPAMIVYIMFLAYPFKRLTEIEKKTYKNKDERYYYYLTIGLKGSLVAYMVASFFAGVAYQWYVYYLVGYAIAARRIYVSRTENELSAKP